MRLSSAFLSVINAIIAAVSRCRLAWRFIVALHYSPRVAWNKARRDA